MKEGENGSGTGFNSRARLPENEQVQYLQKIALRAENKRGPMLLRWTNNYFLRKQFFVAIEATIFRIERRAIEAQRLQSIFT